MSIKRYRTKLCTSLDNEDETNPPYKGLGFTISFERQKRSSGAQIRSSNRRNPVKNIVINARNEKSAQKILDLITFSRCLIYEEYYDPLTDRNFLDIQGKKQPKTIEERVRKVTGSSFGHFQLACRLASKASYRKKFQFAILKCILSSQCYYINSHDLDPSEWHPEPFVLDSIEYIVRCSQAITLAYSVLEELGLEIRASNDKPAIIHGKWNPIVREELIKRLIKAGINISENAVWMRRGTPTKLERKRPLIMPTKTEWAGNITRDCYIELIDAIARASWLRSKVSAHKINELTYSINFYDVANVQYLARRLLLDSVGLWRL
jgi:hypothetical protein